MLSKRATACIVLALGALAFCTTALVFSVGWRKPAYDLVSGFASGSQSAAVTLAAGWTALGFTSFRARVWQSLGVVLLAVAAPFIFSLLRTPAYDLIQVIVAVFGTAAFAQWLVVGGILHLLMCAKGIRLRSANELSPHVQSAELQYGIREALVVMGTTAALLAAGRVIVQSGPDFEIFGLLLMMCFVAICNILVTVPLLVAVLLRRFALASTLAALVLVAVVTACETPAFNRMTGATDMEDQLFHWTMNYVQAMWVLLVLGTLRAGGYRLAAVGCEGVGSQLR